VYQFVSVNTAIIGPSDESPKQPVLVSEVFVIVVWSFLNPHPLSIFLSFSDKGLHRLSRDAHDKKNLQEKARHRVLPDRRELKLVRRHGVGGGADPSPDREEQHLLIIK
jgi:hypothetical protein